MNFNKTCVDIKLKSIILTILLIVMNMYDGNSQVFTISGTKLIDAKGKPFIMRGVNNPHVWLPIKSFNSLERIAGLKSNTVRIVWDMKGKPAKLDKIISKVIELKMIPIVEMHDVTGNPTAEKLLEVTGYYARNDVKEVLLKYEKYLLINIANEWGNHNVTDAYWRDSYKKAIDTLRKAGYKTTIVIDAPGWGQKIDPFFAFGKEVLNHDSLKNILFSIHMYGSWNDSIKIENDLQKAYDLGLPLIVGEFGYNYNNGKNNLGCTVNHLTILKKCNELGYGYLAWSWSGNNKENEWLDLANKKNWKQLNWWGKEVFESKNGISNTAVKASIFD
jgi:mannan endo-1,4-beta-mannosidase